MTKLKELKKALDTAFWLSDADKDGMTVDQIDFYEKALGLMPTLLELADKAQSVIDAWEQGDLAGAVNDLRITLGGLGVTPHVVEPKTKKIEVCKYCGSANVLIDAYVHANDPDDVRTFDDCYCESCGGSCKTITVEVPEDFDVETDIFDLASLK